MPSFWNDIRHGFRMLRRNPGFAIVVVLALALGIGANTAVFSLTHAVLLDPLPYEDPDRLVMVWMRFTGIGIPDDRNWVSPPELMDLRRHSSSFSDLAAMRNASFNIRVGDTPERLQGAMVSASFFRLLGVSPSMGRGFAPPEEERGRDTVVVIGHGLWQRRFGSRPDLLGQSIQLNGAGYTIIGVAPPGFDYPNEAEIWTPLVIPDEQLSPNWRGNHGLLVLGRIKPGLSMEQALADMELVSQRIIEGAPEYPYRDFHFKVLIRPLLEEFVGDIRPALMLLVGAVAAVHLIACANVANLLLVRASVREREIAIRAALGAGRGRLLRQLLTESLLLAIIGGGIGLVVAHYGLATIARLGARAFPRLSEASVNLPALGFTIILALMTGLIFGVVPALKVSQSGSHDSLKEGGRGATSGIAHQKLRRILVVSEVALSLTLLAGAGLLIKSFLRLQEIDPGFRSEGVLTLRVSLPQARYSGEEQIRAFFRELLERVSRVPGVQSAGGTNALPLSGMGGSGTTTVDTTAVPPDQATPEADWRTVTPGYFETMGTRLISGRYFNDHDHETAAPVAIIDDSMAKTFWPNENPLGKRLKRGDTESAQPWMTVVGVVNHTRFFSLERPSRVQVYGPFAQAPGTGLSIAIAGSVEPGSLVEAVRREVAAMDPEQPVYAVRTMDELMTDSVLRRRLIMMLLGSFAAVALGLAALGIYGVVSYWVSQRSHEIGIRLALGASRSAILKMIIGQSLTIVAVGVLVGLMGAFAATRLLETLLFNVSSGDVPTLIAVSTFLLGVGLAAGLLPAYRATTIDPVETLRAE